MGEYICPHCRRPVYDDDALLCHFCGESLRRPGGGFLGRVKYGCRPFMWGAALLAVIGFLMLVLIF